MKSNSTFVVALSFAAIACVSMVKADIAMAGKKGFARGRILVEAKDGVSDADFDKAIAPHGGRGRKIGKRALRIVDLPLGASEVSVVESLKKDPRVKFAELDQVVESTATLNDPYVASAWHIPKIGAPAAWDVTAGENITIAILDSGIDQTHPDLAPSLVTGTNTYDNNNDVSDVCGHGTAVAGAAAAIGNNAIGVAGIAGRAKIMPIRIAYNDPTSGCYGYYSSIAAGVTWAADHGARVANVSYYATSGSSAVQSAARYLKSKGGLLFVSAGNYNQDETALPPTDAMIVVSATDSTDARASFSSWGSFVNLAAPGVGIWVTRPGGAYGTANGTSFSSPVAAGVAALMMSVRPQLSADQVQDILQKTAVDLGAAGRDPIFGFGRVNADEAVKGALSAQIVAPAPTPAPTPVPTPVPAPAPLDTVAPMVSISNPISGAKLSGSVSITVSGSDNSGVTGLKLTILIDGAQKSTKTGVSSMNYSWNTRKVSAGTHTIQAIATDAAGNKSTVSVQVSK